MEEKTKRREDRAERKRLAIEAGDNFEEEDTPEEEVEGPKDFKEAFNNLVEKEKKEKE